MLTTTEMPVASTRTVRWSEAQDWLGSVPQNGDDVIIPEGLTVILDESTPELGTLAVNGKLIFDNKDLKLTAANVVVNGELWVGTEDQPFVNDAQIVLTGKEGDPDVVVADFMQGMQAHSDGDHQDMEKPIDNKALIVTGKLELHGADVKSWTQLAGTVQAGATSLTLAEDVKGWNVGDKIAIAPTDFNPFEAEEVTITGVNGRTISFDQPLKYLHYGEQETLPDGRSLDMRAEVTNLTRNITISGRDEGEVFTSGSGEDYQRWGYGGHTMYMAGSEIHIDGAEFTGLGISGKTGRYPVHFHHGDQMEGSYLKNSSIHHTLQRGLVVHRTEQLLIEGNTIYDTTGHQYFLEEGVEVDNKFYNNLGMLPRTTPQNVRIDEVFVSGKDADVLKRKDRASVFWITNGANEFVGNHAAAVPRGQGFWFTGPDVDTRARGIDPYDSRTQRPTLAFKDNTAHTIMFNQDGGMNLGYGPEWTGVALDITDIRADYNGQYEGVPNAPIENFTAYKVGNIALNPGGLRSEIVNPILAESRILLHIPQGQNGPAVEVVNPALLGETNNNPAGRDIDQYIQSLIETGGFAGPVAFETFGGKGIDVIGGYITDREVFQQLIDGTGGRQDLVNFSPDSAGRTALDPLAASPPPAPAESPVEPPVVLPIESPVEPPIPPVEVPVSEVPVPPLEPPVTPPVPAPDAAPTPPAPPTPPMASGEPVKLVASGQFLNGNTGAQQWNGDVAIAGFAANGAAATIQYGLDGLGVKGDRYDSEVDYSLEFNKSERLALNFKANVSNVSVELGKIFADEWNGLDETGLWKAFDADGIRVAEGILDPTQGQSLGAGIFAFDISAPKPFSKIELEATPYSNGASTANPENSSDFNLRAITYTLANSSAPPVAPPPVAPSPVEPPAPPVGPPVLPVEPTPPPTGGPTPVEPPAPPVEPPVLPVEPTPPPTGGPTPVEPPSFPPTPEPTPEVVVGTPTTLNAAGNFLDGTAAVQTWGDGVTIAGYSAQGEAASVNYGWDGLAVKGGRYDNELDYDTATDSSEQLVLNFNGSVTQASVELGYMSINEGAGLPETGIWTAYSANGDPISTGELDPRTAVATGSGSYRFNIEASGAFDKLVIEASSYGNGNGGGNTADSSDFNLRNVTYTRTGQTSPSPVTPPPVTPPEVILPPVTPPTTTPPEVTPPVVVVPPEITPPPVITPPEPVPPIGNLPERTTLVASANVLNGSEDAQSWGEGVKVSGFDFDGSPAQVVYDTEFQDYGFGVAGTGDRWSQIDYYQNKGGKSEQIRLDFDNAVDDLVVTVGMLGQREGGSFDETGKWTALDSNNAVIGTGLIGPELSVLGANTKVGDSYGKYPIQIDTTAPISALVIESTGFGHGQGQPTQLSYGENNSDFNLMEISFDPVLAAANTMSI
jgi:hypothetical protein